MSEDRPNTKKESLEEIVAQFWIAPEHAEWVPRTDVIPLADLRRWMRSSDIEILGFVYHMIGNGRFRIEPPISPQEYVVYLKQYYERCIRENPDGKWSDIRHSAGMELVNAFGSLWRDLSVPRELLKDLKNWLARLYKESDEDTRACLVTATLEHLVEQKPIREYFSDWREDALLRKAYDEACLWPDGGGNTPLGKPPTR